MTMPPTVNILGLTYTVRRVPVVDKGEYSFGQIDFEEQEILIDGDLSDYRFSVTLLHEVIHGILCELKLHAENNNDTMVNGLAIGLYQCLASNPSLFNINKKIAYNKKHTKKHPPNPPKNREISSKTQKNGNPHFLISVYGLF